MSVLDGKMAILACVAALATGVGGGAAHSQGRTYDGYDTQHDYRHDYRDEERDRRHRYSHCVARSVIARRLQDMGWRGFHNARADGDVVLVDAHQLENGRDYTLTIGRCSGEIHSACPLERRRARVVRRHAPPPPLPRRVVRPAPEPELEPEAARWERERWERWRYYPSDGDNQAARDMRIPEPDTEGWGRDTYASSRRY